MITKDAVESWIKDVWVVYAGDTTFHRKLYIRVGQSGFRVVHGKEILYEGPFLGNAIKIYNAIKSEPHTEEEPKLDN